VAVSLGFASFPVNAERAERAADDGLRWHSRWHSLFYFRSRHIDLCVPSPRRCAVPNQIPVPINDLREVLAVRLAVAPRHLLSILWKPGTAAHDRDKARTELIDFVTQGWEQYNVTRLDRATFDPPTRETL
jgi:hypothetical protein